MKPKKSSSRRWLQEHFSDVYVKKAQQEGYRSRSAYKLIELQERDKLFRPGMTVIDLGASPGGWSQLLTKWVGKKGKVLAVDILPMEPLPDVEFIQGDFTDEATLEKILIAVNHQKVDWVISDMAPNLSGIQSADQARSIYLAELALDLASKVLSPKGRFLVKLFQGEGFDEFLLQVRKRFQKVVIRKPKASRGRSAEVYLLTVVS
ncbi:23S rRNA methyltransferase [Gammaproteobacteria bacterium SCGC AG-212-F23]|nr:23S rRNA methyltransferase [Gammaproteobacteria bacterium SCGC AG-212-F23]